MTIIKEGNTGEEKVYVSRVVIVEYALKGDPRDL